jgi:hypothetical protein
MDGAGRTLAAGVVPVGAVGRLRRRVDARPLRPSGAWARQWPRRRCRPANAAGGNDEDDQYENRRHGRSCHGGQRRLVALC